MSWCHQATSHYLSQCWFRSMSPYGITRLQWVELWHHEPFTIFDKFHLKRNLIYIFNDHIKTNKQTSMKCHGRAGNFSHISMKPKCFRPICSGRWDARDIPWGFNLHVCIMPYCCEKNIPITIKKSISWGTSFPPNRLSDITHICMAIISLWLSDTIWQHRSSSTKAWVMTFHLMAPSHYLNQCWITNQRRSFESTWELIPEKCSWINQWHTFRDYIWKFLKLLPSLPCIFCTRVNKVLVCLYSCM